MQTVLDCLVEDQLYTGSIVERFEKEFKSTFRTKYAITVNSLTSAYHLALLALKVGENDSVFLSTFAPHQALDAILMVNAQPIPIELGKFSYHIDVEIFNQKVKEYNPKAIVVDHTFGCIFDLSKYEVGEVPVIEDFSEALGAETEKVKVGKQGVISIAGLSTNHIITIGNGAVITTQNDEMAKFIKYSKYGSGEVRSDKNPKLDYNLIDYQAAMGIEQLSKLGLIIERKKKIAQLYLQAALSASHETYFKNASEELFNRFPIVVSKSYDEVERYFQSLRIGTEKTTPQPIHKILELPNSDFPNAERLFQRGHCLPIYPNLSKDNINRIANSIRGIY
ncbi:MAG: DegT/DnrJ/EryC1/StrS aminotransferase family protein [Leptospiraceae bacterium]|nr:DegT/DnrJ/EryC1/StrS aminotransferase family protein [Leptospiraceae bacterium]MCP5496894.1 DegT/DnrJ/EryC1/StrS aminotransferase family protein [Leptospiraceae bacterium]